MVIRSHLKTKTFKMQGVLSKQKLKYNWSEKFHIRTPIKFIICIQNYKAEYLLMLRTKMYSQHNEFSMYIIQ